MAAPMQTDCGGGEKEENSIFSDDDKAKQIFSQYELFHRIFKYLPAKSLNTSCIVCKDWRREIEKIKTCQKKLSYMMYDSAKRRKYDDHAPILELSKRIQNLPSEPKHVLFFSSLALYEGGIHLPASTVQHKPSPRPRAAKRPKSGETKSTMLEFLRGRLPKACQIHGVSASGVIGTDERIGSPQELDRYHVNAGSLLFLSHIPGVDIYSFSTDQESEDNGLAEFAETAVENGGIPEVPEGVVHSITGIPNGAQVRCVLYFRTDHNTESPHDLCHAFMKMYKQVVVAGGYVDQFIPEDEDAKYLDDPNATEPSLKGIAFCGEDIEVASVVLKSSVKDKQDIDAKLKKLKDTGIRINKHTIAFMFACVGRGHHLHNASNVEADIFKKHFPRVPLFGLFGNGEIGYDYLPDYTSPEKDGVYSIMTESYDEDDEMRIWELPEMHLSYSTIFVVLSLPVAKT